MPENINLQTINNKLDKLISQEDKLEQILKYQKRVHHWTIGFGILKIIILLVIIIGPIIALPYIMESITTNLPDFISSQISNFQNDIDTNQILKILGQ